MRRRQIAPVALVLLVTVAGFIAARMLSERDDRRDSDRRAEGRGGRRSGPASPRLRRSRRVLGSSCRTPAGSASRATSSPGTRLRWLSSAGFPAAAWVERIPMRGVRPYERRLGQPIVTPGALHTVVPRGSRTTYLPATLVSGFPPTSLPGTDLSADSGIAATLARANRVGGVTATPLAPASTGINGLFLVAPAPNLIDAALHPGYVAVFVPAAILRSATDEPAVRITTPTAAPERTGTARRSFMVAGRRFDVAVSRQSAGGPATVLPWIILAAGLVLAGLAAALGANAARRAKAQADLDRVFKRLPRPDRRRQLRRALHARQPGGRGDPRLYRAGAPRQAVRRLRPPRRPREDGGGGRGAQPGPDDARVSRTASCARTARTGSSSGRRRPTSRPA